MLSGKKFTAADDQAWGLVQLSCPPEKKEAFVVCNTQIEIWRWLPIAFMQLGVAKSGKYVLYVQGAKDAVDVTRTFQEAGITPTTQLELKAKLATAKTVSEYSTLANGIAASALVNPSKAGSLQKKNKKDKWRDRWFVLANRLLYMYKTPSERTPSHVLPLKYFSIRTFADEKKGVFAGKKEYIFEVFSEQTVPASVKKTLLVLKAGSEEQLDSWVSSMRDEAGCAVIVVAEKEKKKKRSKEDGPCVFGVPLAEQVSSSDGSELPPLFTSAIQLIEERGMETEGIFRLSGSQTRIAEYKARYDRGEEVDLAAETDIHTIAGVFKLYLREMPEPLLTFELFANFVEGVRCPDELVRIRYLRHLINQLPRLNKAALKHLVRFLQKINAKSSVNKMGVQNLATIFGPCLLKNADQSMAQLVEDTAVINQVVDVVISDYDYIVENAAVDKRPPSEASKLCKARAACDYSPDPSLPHTQLALKTGVVVNVISKDEKTGWWKGEIDDEGKFGVFPRSYVDMMDDAQIEHYYRNLALEKQKAELRELIEQEKNVIARLEDDIERYRRIVSEVETQRAGKVMPREQEKNAIVGILQQLSSDSCAKKLSGHLHELSKIEKSQRERVIEDICVSSQTLLKQLESLKAAINERIFKKAKDKEKQQLESVVAAIDSIASQLAKIEKSFTSVLVPDDEIIWMKKILDGGYFAGIHELVSL